MRRELFPERNSSGDAGKPGVRYSESLDGGWRMLCWKEWRKRELLHKVCNAQPNKPVNSNPSESKYFPWKLLKLRARTMSFEGAESNEHNISGGFLAKTKSEVEVHGPSLRPNSGRYFQGPA
jgi:hypothetical protein